MALKLHRIYFLTPHISEKCFYIIMSAGLSFYPHCFSGYSPVLLTSYFIDLAIYGKAADNVSVLFVHAHIAGLIRSVDLVVRLDRYQHMVGRGQGVDDQHT